MEQKKSLFKSFISELNTKHDQVCDEHKYIGTGNPLSNILIIGKEAALQVDSPQYSEEILNNISYWTKLEDYNAESILERDFENFSPLYPYRGQILLKDNNSNFGTSVTWMNYQKLFNHIFDYRDNKNVNFHENIFITEVNSTPNKKTKDANTDSIAFRKKEILSSDFFQSFPIVIISGVGYFENTADGNEINEIFGVEFSEKKFANNDKESQPYWIHWNEDKTKIVINTYQLSIGISDSLLENVAREIKESCLLGE